MEPQRPFKRHIVVEGKASSSLIFLAFRRFILEEAGAAGALMLRGEEVYALKDALKKVNI